MKSINVSQLQALRLGTEPYYLIDVREEAEFEAGNIGGHLIPMASVLLHMEEIPRDKMVIIHCRSGKRSEMAIRMLENNAQFDNLYNLEGGILAWAKEIDPSLTRL